MKRLALLLLATLLCSCGTSLTTSNPVQSYAATKVYRAKDGSLQIAGDWDYIVLSTTTDPPQAVIGGFKARLLGGKVMYSHYVHDLVYKAKAGSFADDPNDVTGNTRLLPYDRATLDQAAQNSGLTVSLPQYRSRQVFSAAHLRGFLQRVDETVRNPSGATILPGPWTLHH